MKKFKLMLVAFMAMFGVNAFAQAPGPYSNSTFKYDYDGTGCVITGLQEDIKSTITEVAIPETVPVNGTAKPVTGIGWEAFKGLTQITSVSIAKNVTHIDGGAFSGCTHLATVDLSAATGLTTLGNEVFAGTPSLTSLSFANCAKLVAFRIDFDATSAAAYNATLYGAVITGASYDATTEPTDAEIQAVAAGYTSGDPITAADAATYNASLVGAVAAGDTWSYTPFVAFGGKNNYLTSVTLNENTTEIGVAFANIPNLATLDLSGTKLAALRANALDYNTKITSLELPNTCQTIESSALANTAVATLTINSLAAKPQDIATTVYGATDVLTSLEFKGVTKADIAANAFNGTKLATLKFAEVQTNTANGIAASAFKLADAACTVTIAKIASADAFTASAITGPATATNKVALTISDVSAQPAKLVSANVGTATVGSVNANFSVDALGDAQTIVFTTAFAEGKTLVAATNAVAATKVVFGTETAGIALAAGSIVANAFKDAATCSFYWFPETATAAFAADFAKNAAVGGGSYTEALMSNKLFTTTAVAEKYQTPFLNDTELLYNVYIKASATAAETQEIEVAKNSGDFYYGKFIAIGSNYSIDADDAVVYSAYVDGENIYMDPLRIVDGKYVVFADEAVVIKNNTGDAVTATATNDAETMRHDNLGALVNDIQYEIDGLGAPKAVVGYEIIDALAAGKAAYAMAKPEKYNLSWKTFKPTTNLAAGTIYIVTDAAAGDRLNIIWLDNSEEATAIQTVKGAKAENGAIYNLAGQKVNAAYKGVVIKDGKKYMQK